MCDWAVGAGAQPTRALPAASHVAETGCFGNADGLDAMTPGPALYALLIGINDYHPDAGVRSLRGCVNDVRAAARLLADLYGVPQENMVTLVDQAATRAAIEQAVQQHLIARAHAWLDPAAPQDVPPPAFLLYFSGHGSQARDLSGQEPDGMDETLVAYDSRTPGVFDLRDWELAAWLEELNAASDNVTVILDCCHSGSGTRDLDEGEAPTRGVAPDLRLPPSVRPPAAQGRALGSSARPPGHVLLAACRDRELARELSVPDASGPVWRGTLSHTLQEVLYAWAGGQEMTYRDLHEQVRARVRQIYTQQTPQCEGDRDRLVLGGLRAARAPFFTVLAEEEGLLWVDAGVLHGLRAGGRLRACAAQARTPADAGAPLATLEVVREGIERSGCRVLEAGRTLPLPARAAVEQPGRAVQPCRVRPALAPGPLHDALRARLAAADLSGWIELVETGEEMQVVEREGALQLADRAGEPLAGPYALDDIEALALDLAHMARFRHVLALRNDAPDALPAGSVALAIKKLDFDPASGAPRALPIEESSGALRVEEGTRLVFEVTNRSVRPLYVGLFNLSARCEIEPLWPTVAGAREALGPGRSLVLGRSARLRDQLAALLPEGVLETSEQFKLFAAAADVDYSLLRQGPLGVPFQAPGPARASAAGLEQTLVQVMGGVRGGTSGGASAAWTSVQLGLRIVAAEGRAARAGLHARLPVRAEPPPGFAGVVEPVAAGAIARDGGAVPPGLAPFPGLFRPLAAGAPGSGPLLFRVLCDEGARRLLSPQSPLRLRFDRACAQPVLAVAHNGEGWFPVGRAAAGSTLLEIGWLPAPASAGAPLRVALYAITGARLPAPGLYNVRFVPQAWTATASPAAFAPSVPGGELRYTRATRLRAGRRTALVLASVPGESAPLAHMLLETLPAHALVYDRVLAFEHEALQVGVQAAAARLADALARVVPPGAPGLAVDLFAQGAGALVARTWVELLGGAEQAGRVVLFAPPNRGTPLAGAGLLLEAMAVLALNRAGPAPPAPLSAWALGAGEAGAADLAPGAALLERPATDESDARTRYFVVTGEGAEAGGGRVDALLRTLAEGRSGSTPWFEGAHDGVVEVASALALRVGRAPGSLLLTCVLPALHGGYGEDETALAQVAHWLADAPAAPAAHAADVAAAADAAVRPSLPEVRAWAGPAALPAQRPRRVVRFRRPPAR